MCRRFALYLLSFSLFLASGYLQAQESNPFDLEHNISKKAKWTTEVEEVLPTAIPTPDSLPNEVEAAQIDPAFITPKLEGNPFDLDTKNIVVEDIKAEPIKPKEKVTLSEAVKTGVLQFKIGISILLMVSLTLISTLLRHVIIKTFEGFKSDNLLRTYFRSTGRRVSLPNFLLELFFVVNAAFSCFLFLEYSNLLVDNPIVEFLKILGTILVILLGKHAVLYVVSEVFPIKKEVAEYNFTITLFLSILGLLLMPCNLILGFAPAAMATFSLYFIGLLTVLVLGYLVVRSILIGSKFLSSNRFHFFMYLCTVEIAPLFILFKVVKNYIGS